MITWKLYWRSDLGIFERICEHGIGHPDPDSLSFLRKKTDDTALSIHECDGCCVSNKDLI